MLGLKRRGLGPAYERSPWETIVEWTARNTLALLGGLMMGFLWIVAVHVFVDMIMNFLATGGDESLERPWDVDHPWVVTAKLVGGVVVAFVTVRMRSK